MNEIDRGDFWVDLQWHGDPDPNPSPDPDPKPDVDPPPKDEPLTLEDVKKLIQSETDKVRTDYSGRLKEKETELDELKKEKMSAAQLAKYEAEQRDKELVDKTAKLAERELALDKASVIADLEVPKDLAPFVTGDSKETILSSAKALMDTFAKEVLKGVEKKLIDSGDPPEVGDDIVLPTNLAELDAMGLKVNAMSPGPERDKADAVFLEAASKIKE